MKVLITENKLYNAIERYILDGFPMVKSVTFSTRPEGYIWGFEDNDVTSKESPLLKNVISVGFINGKMTHSPTWTLKQIKREINSMFGLNIGERKTKWELDGKWEK
jgi:hypothetical protein